MGVGSTVVHTGWSNARCGVAGACLPGFIVSRARGPNSISLVTTVGTRGDTVMPVSGEKRE